MKRKFWIILALAALILALACGAALADESGSCGDNVTYSFNSANGMLTISGTGAMADYDMSGNLSPFARNAEILTVNVNEGVTAIGYAAFYGCSGITEVSLPENVSVIKGHAFRNCSGLDHITLPNGLESIGTGAFSFCRGLTGVTLPDGLTVINNGAFINCTNLTTVSIPGSVVSVGGNAFLGCTSLAGATFHNPDTIIDADAFTGANGNLTLYGWNPSTAKDYADAHSDAVSFESLGSLTGSCSKNVTWAFDPATGTLTISGTGYIANYVSATAVPWYGFRSNIHSVSIANGVTEIGNRAFFGCTSLTNVTIPNSVTRIGWSAFMNCIGLTSVTILNPDCMIGESNYDVFENCASGFTLRGYSGSTAEAYAANTVNPCAFESLGSQAIQTGSCGDNVTWAFDPATGVLTISGTGAMTNYSSASNVPWYSYRENFASVTIGSGVTNVGNRAFYQCTGLTSVTIPANVTNVGCWAFRYCANLTSVTILNPYCVIGDSSYDVFESCASGFTLRGYSGSTAEAYAANTVNPCTFESLDSQSIQTGSCGDNVTWTLDPNTGLLTISGTGATYDYDYLYNPSPFDEKTNITSAVFSTGITRVGSWLLDDCANLTSVSIPATVETIGEGAFYACGLTELTIPEGVTVLEKWAFNSNTQLSTLLLPDTLTTIGVAPFANCSSLANVTIPDSVTSIGYGAFYGCTGLTSVTIPDSVTNIGVSAFALCTNLTSVTILNPDCVIGDSNSDVFNGCSSGMVLRGLTNSTAYLYAQAAGITFESLGTYTGVLTGSCGENLTYSLDTGIGMLTITGTGEMANYSSSENVPWYGYRSGITSVSIGSSVTSICESAFYYCTGLTGITIPDSVTSIGSGAFWGCSSLTSATIPSSVTSIGNATFADCTGLTSVTIPDSVTSIGRCAFDGCTGLTSVTIPNSVMNIGISAFDGCTGLTSVTIPGSVTRIYVLAFEDCANLADVTILNPTCVIGDSDYDVFENCASGFTLRGYSGSTAETYANAAGIDFVPIPTAAFVLPAALTTIESEAFSGIAAEAVLIPASVISISGNPFAGSSVHYIYGSTDLVRNFAQAYGYVFVPIGD